MPKIETLNVLVRSDTGKTSPGRIRVQHWEKKDRTRRALRFWLYCWVLSFLAIALPVLHFFLVPILFIAGPVGAWIVSTQSSTVMGGESICPDCGAPLPLSAGTDDWPLKDLCSACQQRMKIEKVVP